MKGSIALVFLLSLFQCHSSSELDTCSDSGCATEAKVVDMTGLDGCGIMFELADGTRLEPERRTYITAPTIEEDPLYHFELKVGQQVKISWEESLALSACLAGPIVFVTCITECKKPD